MLLVVLDIAETKSSQFFLYETLLIVIAERWFELVETLGDSKFWIFFASDLKLFPYFPIIGLFLHIFIFSSFSLSLEQN